MALHREQGLDFSGVTTFNLDEYVGLPGRTPEERARHPESYARYMEQALFSRLPARFADARVPLVLHAPGYWQPAPAQDPPLRWFFRVPAGARDAQIFFEGPTRLFDPAGKPAALVFTAPDDAERKMDALFRLAENLADHVDGGTVVLDAESKRLHKVTPQGSSRARGQEYLFKPGGRRFDDLKLRYSLVLIDAPPLTQSSAVEMAAQADGVYLMIRLGDTTPRALGEAVDVLRRTGAKLRGSIVIDDGISPG